MDEAKTQAALARGIFRKAERAALGTLAEGGSPYVSLVLVAEAADGAPILLVSDLAEHAKNLSRDPRGALLIDGTGGLADPLTGPRATLMGRLEKSGDARLKAQFVARHPPASVYAGFKDFAIWRMEIERVHLVEGFGRIFWIEGKDFRTAKG
jgi:heme oxygenase (biliverdin-IX-beta and delta-forming)